jgi:hypothetical protein
MSNATITNDPIKAKLIGFLAAGVPPAAAATAAGVTPAYVTQLLDDDEFRTEVINASAERLDVAIKQDTTVESIKTKALRVIEAKLPFVRSSLEAARIYQILSAAPKNAPTGSTQSGQAGVNMVTIVLPKAAGINLKLNTLNQVIEIEGQTMATLPSRELPLLQRKDAAKAEEVLDKVAPMNTVIGGVVRVL